MRSECSKRGGDRRGLADGVIGDGAIHPFGPDMRAAAARSTVVVACTAPRRAQNLGAVGVIEVKLRYCIVPRRGFTPLCSSYSSSCSSYVPKSVLVMKTVGSITVAIGFSSLERRRKPSRSRRCKNPAYRASPALAHLRRCFELGGELFDAVLKDGPHFLFSHPGALTPGAAHSSRSTARRELNRSQQQLVAARTTHSHISTTLPPGRQGPRSAQRRTVDHFA